MRTVEKLKVEYGDFQTPIELADQVCKKLVELGVKPDIIIEPTCGTVMYLIVLKAQFALV